MMLKFGKNLLHLLNKNCFKFDTNLMVDLGGTIFWNKTPEALSWKSFRELHYKYLLHTTSFHAYFLHTSFSWTTLSTHKN
jgi:hypothetical protein